MNIYNIDNVKKIDWQMVEPELLGGDMAEDLEYYINNACRFTLKKWWSIRNFDKEAKQEYLTLKGSYDKTIRPSIYYSVSLAIAIKFKIYNQTSIKEQLFVARDKCCKLIRSTARQHICNMPNGWGQSQAHVSWLSELALSAWIMWEFLNVRDRQLIVNALEYSANELLQTKPMYTYSETGKIREKGENKAVDMSCDAKLLLMATTMLDKNSNCQLWTDKMIEFYKASFRMSQGDSDYNVNADGSINSYDRVSPYAMTTIVNNMLTYNIAKLTFGDMQVEALANLSKIYAEFYKGEVDQEGIMRGSMCVVDSKGRPTVKVSNYIKGGKGGRLRQSTLYLMDVYAFALNFDEGLHYRAKQWAKVRMKYIIRRQKKHPNGNYSYCSRRPRQSFKSEIVSSNLAVAYMTLFNFISKPNNN